MSWPWGVVVTAVAVAVMAGGAWAQPWRFDDVTVVGCYDGDMCTVTLPGVHPLFGREARVRLLGVDTPEIRGACEAEKALARKARAFTRKLVSSARRVDLVGVTGLDNFGRILGRLEADGVCVGEALMGAGLAQVFRENTSPAWC